MTDDHEGTDFSMYLRLCDLEEIMIEVLVVILVLPLSIYLSIYLYVDYNAYNSHGHHLYI